MPENNAPPVTKNQIDNTTYIIEAIRRQGVTDILYMKAKLA